ncbi:hypothetical protein LZC95_52830 [Pendulispora brunnea]|uniref:Uncharacterized protein n=1 Tax=Pendulispora brunnea TaxID=2905690 RepID=A0ABZ2K8V4_9BACT
MWKHVVCASVVCLVASPRPAWAADTTPHETARLTYETGDTAGCPDESSFHNLVAARLGYDPFRPDGQHAVSVSFRKERAKIRARAEVQRGGPAAGTREFTGEACEPLAAALATTVAMALDPLHVSAPAAEPPPPAGATSLAGETPALHKAEPLPTLPGEPQPTPPPQVVFVERRTNPTPSRPSEPSEPVAFLASVGGVVSFALAPTMTLGGAMEIGFRYGVFSLSAEGRAELTPTTTRVDSGDRVDATIYSGALLPCFHFGAWLGCAVGRIGAFQGRAPDVVHPSLGTSAFGSVGLRGGYMIPLTKVLSVRASVEGAIPVVRTTLVIDGGEVWTAPPVTAGLDFAFVLTLK